MLSSPSVFARRLIAWYDRCHRKLPWRADPACRNGDAPGVAGSDPYHVLVSEAMLQQTQVATVVPYFNRFIERFPTIAHLAAADEQEVLRMWQGLGYYSRARNLRAAARAVVGDHGGQIPRDPAALLRLPGIGRYTAGAVASIAFDRRAPILDGNVVRVLCRVDRIESDPRDRATHQLLWSGAEQILPRKRVGTFNSALMELGATVCTPRSPQCLLCPVQPHCEAFAAGVQERIPTPRKARQTPLLRRVTFCIRQSDPQGDHYLIEQRPTRGRWAGMWQFITLPADECAAGGNPPAIPPALAATLPVRVGPARHLGIITHGLTHRRYHFDVFACDALNPGDNPHPDLTPHPQTTRTWTRLEDLSAYPLPRPHLKIAAMLESLPRTTAPSATTPTR